MLGTRIKLWWGDYIDSVPPLVDLMYVCVIPVYLFVCGCVYLHFVLHLCTIQVS